MDQAPYPPPRKIGEITLDVLEIGKNRDVDLRQPTAGDESGDLFKAAIDDRVLLIRSPLPRSRVFAVSIEQLLTLATEMIVADTGDDPEAIEPSHLHVVGGTNQEGPLQ